MNESVIERIKGSEKATITAPSSSALKNKLKKLAEENPDCDFYENTDGSAFGHVPLSYIAVRKPRQLSEEHKRILAEKLALAREERNK